MRCEITKAYQLLIICKTSKICCETFKKSKNTKKIKKKLSLKILRVYVYLKNTLSTENVKSEYGGQKEKNSNEYNWNLCFLSKAVVNQTIPGASHPWNYHFTGCPNLNMTIKWTLFYLIPSMWYSVTIRTLLKAIKKIFPNSGISKM